MDIQRAINTLNKLVLCGSCTTGPCDDCDRKNAKDTAIQGLKELQQYRQIGTVEECREAMEKSQKPIPITVAGGDIDELIIKACGHIKKRKCHMDIAKIIKQKRQEQGLSKQQLADMAGVTKRAILYWEKGERQMSIDNADKLLKALHASVMLGEPVRKEGE